MADFMDYTEAEFENRYYEIKLITINGKESVADPRAVLLGGQPGAGKSSMIKKFETLFPDKGVVIISGDDYRKYHPHFDGLYAQYGDDYVNHTQKFSSQVTERLIEELSREKYNLIIEGTLRTAMVPLKTADLLQERGYHVELAVMAVPPALSYAGTIERYERMKEIGTTPRMTTKLQHDNTVRSIVNSLDEVYRTGRFDDIRLFNRQSECLYRQTDTPMLNPKDILQREHNRGLTAGEKKYLDDVVKYIGSRWEKSGEYVLDDRKSMLESVRREAGSGYFRAELLENGFTVTENLMKNYNDLLNRSGRTWQLSEIADEYKSGNPAVQEIGCELEQQELAAKQVEIPENGV